MNALPKVAALIAAGSLAAPAMAQAATQPPMNQFNDAYYTCDGGSFLVSYDSNQPQTATLTTSNNNKTFSLKRTPVATGAEFSDGATKFWTDGKTTTIDGTAQPFRSCALKPD